MNILDANMALQNLLFELQQMDNPHEMILKITQYARDYYDADCCSEIQVSNKFGIWLPVMRTGRKGKPVKFPEISDGWQSWKEALNRLCQLVITDITSIRSTSPAEYDYYQTHHISNLIGIPFQYQEQGFLFVFNSKVHDEETEFLGVLAKLICNIRKKMNEELQKTGKQVARFITEADPASVKAGDVSWIDGLNGEANTGTYIESNAGLYIESNIGFNSESNIDATPLDIEFHFLGNIEICANNRILKESEYCAPIFWKIIVFLVVYRNRYFRARDLADKIHYETETDQSAKNIRAIIGRMKDKCREALGIELIQSNTKTGYRINPNYNIHTDYEMFEKYRDMSLQAEGPEERIRYLCNAADIYGGSFFYTNGSAGEFAAIGATYTQYYVEIIYTLLRELEAKKDYRSLQKYASMAVANEPYDTELYKYQYIGVNRTRGFEYAQEVLKAAKRNLDQDQYEELVKAIYKAV